MCGHIIAVGREVNSDTIGERILIERCIREANGKIMEEKWPNIKREDVQINLMK